MNVIRSNRLLALSCAAILWATPSILAQVSLHEEPAIEARASLPDAPGSLLFSDSAAPASLLDAAQPTAAGGPTAPRHHRIIKANEIAQPLEAKDKFVMAFRGVAGITTVAGSLFSAGWGQLNDSRPHYGTDSGAFGERLGASALNGASRAFFSYGVYASLFHQDPRYYIMGETHTFKQRAIYSATRVVLVGGPDQHSALNWSNLAGTASSAALSNAYYPEVDREASRTVTSALTSLATQAAMNELHEFLGDVLKKVHHKR
jgi:hypothetical protein